MKHIVQSGKTILRLFVTQSNDIVQCCTMSMMSSLYIYLASIVIHKHVLSGVTMTVMLSSPCKY